MLTRTQKIAEMQDRIDRGLATPMTSVLKAEYEALTDEQFDARQSAAISATVSRLAVDAFKLRA